MDKQEVDAGRLLFSYQRIKHTAESIQAGLIRPKCGCEMIIEEIDAMTANLHELGLAEIIVAANELGITGLPIPAEEKPAEDGSE